jgi:hypothetical protein
MEGTVAPLVIGRLMCRPFVPPILGFDFCPALHAFRMAVKAVKVLSTLSAIFKGSEIA